MAGGRHAAARITSGPRRRYDFWMSKRAAFRGLLVLAAVVVVWRSLPTPTGNTSQQAAVLAAAWEDGTSGVWVEGTGAVVRILPDDRQGSRHQRFILSVSPGHTVLISHNIDLAPRIDALQVGDQIRFRGRYEWNDQGGLIHWTHHDPDGAISGGWLEAKGQRLR